MSTDKLAEAIARLRANEHPTLPLWSHAQSDWVYKGIGYKDPAQAEHLWVNDLLDWADSLKVDIKAVCDAAESAPRVEGNLELEPEADCAPFRTLKASAPVLVNEGFNASQIPAGTGVLGAPALPAEVQDAIERIRNRVKVGIWPYLEADIETLLAHLRSQPAPPSEREYLLKLGEEIGGMRLTDVEGNRLSAKELRAKIISHSKAGWQEYDRAHARLQAAPPAPALTRQQFDVAMEGYDVGNTTKQTVLERLNAALRAAAGEKKP